MSKFILPFSVISQATGLNAVQDLDENSENKNIMYFQTDSLTIRNTDLAPLHIDGDPFKTAPEFKISIIREGLCLLQP